MITGVIPDCPGNSQLQFNFIASFSSLEVSKSEQWWDANYYTYIMLHRGSSAASLQEKIVQHMKTYYPETGFLAYHLQEFKDVHLYAPVDNGLEPAGDYRYVYIFSGITLLILLIACFNYVNLATARASDRAKEVGMRKALGAIRRQLMMQFLGESLIVMLAAVLIGLLLVKLTLPWFHEVSGKQLEMSQLLKPLPAITLLSIATFIGLLGGGYPALILSKYNPVTTLKGGLFRPGSGKGLRQMLMLAIVLACLGLMGLVAYTAKQRTKEIGVRKVLGASVTQITLMLSRGFLRPILIAILIAFPTAWLGMNRWLDAFAYKIELSWTLFAAGAVITICVALLTTSFQSINAARTNPVDSLRNE